jgi:flagellar hook protein FlgE
MLRSLFAGVSGLRSSQQMMDIVGNNIANVNTTGFKSSSAVFQDLLSQTLAGAGAPTGNLGGTNPAQVGLGVRVAGISTNWTQGSLQVTGRSSDLAIQGDGFFIVNAGGQQSYTRAGNFEFDANGNLVTQTGAKVQGWTADPISHVVNTNGPIGNLTMPPGQLLAPVKTDNIRLGNMLSADAAIGTSVQTALTAYDSQGIENQISFTFTKTATNQWKCEAFDGDGSSLGAMQINFSPATGLISSQNMLDSLGVPVTPADPTFNISPHPAANWPTGILVSFGNPSVNTDALKEFGGSSTVSGIKQDGSEAGTLQSFKISSSGVVTGVFSNGQSITVGQVAMAMFNNPSGLEKAGDSAFRETPNSGLPQVGTAGSGGRGLMASGSVEMSNVDLGAEFTNLIISQRGFQANSKVVTTADTILETLMGMKR